MPDHRITLDQQTIRPDLAGRVPVTDMPRQLRKAATGDGKQILLGGTNLHPRAIRQHQSITMIQ
jgi:hypothetical protein